MNPTNFPGNQKKKRQGALDRLRAQLAKGLDSKEKTQYVKEQIAILEAKLKASV